MPTYERQVRRNVMPAPNINQEAFGGGVSRAKMGMAQAGQGLINELQRQMVERKERQNDVELNQALNDFQAEVNQMLNDPDEGLFNTRKAHSAAGVTDEVGQKLQELRKKYLGGLTGGEYQINAYNQRADAYENNYINMVSKYEANENENAFKLTEQSANEADATIIRMNATNDEIVNKQMEVAKSRIIASCVTRGLNEAGTKHEVQQYEGQMAANRIIALTENDEVSKARQVLQEQRERIALYNPDAVVQLERVVRDGEVREQSRLVYAAVKEYKMTDGIPDVAKVDSYIDKLDGYNDDEKAKLKDLVKGQMSNDYAASRQRIHANDRQFTNDVYDHYWGGGSFEKAMEVVDKMSRDDTDKASKRQFVYSLYGLNEDGTPKTHKKESNSEVYLDLWTRQQLGDEVTDQEINMFHKQELLSDTHFIELRKGNVKGEAGQQDVARKNAIDRVKAEFSPKSDKEASKFLSAFATAIEKINDPNQVYAVGKEMSEKREKSGIGWFEGIFTGAGREAKREYKRKGKYNYTAEYVEYGDKRLLKTELGEIMGQELTYHFRNNMTEMAALGMNVGGDVAELREGGAVNNAMKFLAARKIAVTENNLRTLLDRYPDGKVPVDLEVMYE